LDRNREKLHDNRVWQFSTIQSLSRQLSFAEEVAVSEMLERSQISHAKKRIETQLNEIELKSKFDFPIADFGILAKRNCTKEDHNPQNQRLLEVCSFGWDDGWVERGADSASRHRLADSTSLLRMVEETAGTRCFNLAAG
jgi:hypothetical protein